MRRCLALCTGLMLAACGGGEPEPQVVGLAEAMAMPVLPPAETVTLDGRAYQVRFIPEGGMAYTARPTGEIGPDGIPVVEEGNFRADAFRVAGAEDKMEAVAVYLQFCHGINEVAPIWGDEPVARDPATGEYSFEYPDDCPAWRARAG